MKLAPLLIATGLLGFSCGHAARKPKIEPGRYLKTIQEDGRMRSYILHVPKNYDNKTKLPLVLLFHGWTSNAAQAEVYTKFGTKSDKEGFILVVPDGTEGIGSYKGWNTGFLNLGNRNADDVKFAQDILDQVERDMLVDENRVYVAGHSNGAMMAYDLGAELSDRIAAIGIVSGTVGTDQGSVVSPKKPVSAIIFHGLLDDTVPYDSSTTGLIKSTSAPDSAKWWADKDGCPAAVEAKSADGAFTTIDYAGGQNHTEVELFTIVRGTHAWPGASKHDKVNATDLMWDFFRSHPRQP